MKDKRYRECMAEIMGILHKYDYAGAITIVTKERSFFKYFFPKWTVLTLIPGKANLEGFHLRSKAEDFPSKEAQMEANTLTAHVVMQMGDIAVNTLAMSTALGALMKEKWGMEHKGGQDFDPELDQ